jgi:hypothetical protein
MLFTMMKYQSNYWFLTINKYLKKITHTLWHMSHITLFYLLKYVDISILYTNLPLSITYKCLPYRFQTPTFLIIINLHIKRLNILMKYRSTFILRLFFLIKFPLHRKTFYLITIKYLRFSFDILCIRTDTPTLQLFPIIIKI